MSEDFCIALGCWARATQRLMVRAKEGIVIMPYCPFHHREAILRLQALEGERILRHQMPELFTTGTVN